MNKAKEYIAVEVALAPLAIIQQVSNAQIKDFAAMLSKNMVMMIRLLE